MKAFFVSDIHLKNSDDSRALTFLRFLHELPSEEATHLFLVGDIFDLWIGNHAFFRKKFGPIADALKSLVAAGIEVHFFEGNHDLHLESFWNQELGVKVHGSAEYFNLDGRVVRVEHGDEMNPDDTGYLFLRWLLRTPVMKFISLHLPGWIVSRIGERASSVSRHHTSTAKELPQEKIRQIVRTHAESVYAARPFDLLISGHVHVIDDHDFKMGQAKVRSVNLGAWFDHPKVFELSADRSDFILL